MFINSIFLLFQIQRSSENSFLFLPGGLIQLHCSRQYKTFHLMRIPYKFFIFDLHSPHQLPLYLSNFSL